MSMQQQVMIVNWRWTEFDEGINETVFKEKKYQQYLNRIEDLEGQCYKEYSVEYSQMCPNGLFVSMSIYKDKVTDPLFFNILGKYLNGNNEVLLFLHKRHMYDEKDVISILKKFEGKNLKCFLIAQGHDFIYFHTQKSGLLDESGGFFYAESTDKEFVRTFDKGSHKVRQPYFDRVWMHYQFELQNKIFELKEELFAWCLPLLLPEHPEEIAVGDLKTQLANAQGRALLSRINNFLGDLKKNPSSSRLLIDRQVLSREVEERKEIQRLEKAEGRSYFFNDYITNFKLQEKASSNSEANKLYKKTCDQLNTIFYGTESYTSKTALRELADDFSQLIQESPGLLAY